MLQRKACSAALVFWRHVERKEQVFYCSSWPSNCCFSWTACPTFCFRGITIKSDKWAFCNSIKDLSEECEHSTMNRKLYFINRLTGDCINTINSALKKFKKVHKKHYETMRTFLDSYPAQVMWKKLFKQDSLYRFC